MLINVLNICFCPVLVLCFFIMDWLSTGTGVRYVDRATNCINNDDDDGMGKKRIIITCQLCNKSKNTVVSGEQKTNNSRFRSSVTITHDFFPNNTFFSFDTVNKIVHTIWKVNNLLSFYWNINIFNEKCANETVSVTSFFLQIYPFVLLWDVYIKNCNAYGWLDLF